jgi:inhibitor of cysteine peptidase
MKKRKSVFRMKTLRWTAVLLVVVAGLLLVSCGDIAGGDKADVDRVTTQSMAGTPPRYFANVSGHYPDQCTSMGRTQQRVASKTIMVTMYTNQTGDAWCAPVLVPFRERILLDVRGLSAGQYSVDVNGAVTTLNLREDH